MPHSLGPAASRGRYRTRDVEQYPSGAKATPTVKGKAPEITILQAQALLAFVDISDVLGRRD